MRNRVWSSIPILLAQAAVAIAMAAPVAGVTYYVSTSTGDDHRDGMAVRWDGVHGPWRSLARASAATYAPGDRLLLKCGDTWDETLTLRGDGTPSQPVVVSSYGVGERPTIRRTLGKGQGCIEIDDACGYLIRDLEIGNAQSGIHVRLGTRRPEYPFFWIKDCLFHDISNPLCPNEGEPWGWAIWWDGPGSARDIRVTGCLGLRTQAFFKGQSNKTGVLFQGNTISHGSYNQVFQSETMGFDILDCVFVYNYPWRYFPFGITQVIAGNLPGGPGVRYDVKHNEFGWAGDYPGAPDGCGYDFEVDSNGVTFQRNFVHNSYGEAVLFMGGKRQQNMLFADNLFRDNVRFSPRWDCTIALFEDMRGSGQFRNNTFYLWPGKKVFAARPTCFTYVANNEHPTRKFAAMPLVTRIASTRAGRTYWLTCATPRATIRYTLDGSLPRTSSPAYTGPITVRRSGVINAKAFRADLWPSYVNSLAVEMRRPEGAPRAIRPTGSTVTGRTTAIRGEFTVSMWARPTGPGKATTETGSGMGLTGVDWWKMGEGVGSTLADTVGGSPGTLKGCNWTRDAAGPALGFNGNGDSVSFGGFGSGGRGSVSNSFTVAFWAAPDASRKTTDEANTGVAGIGGQRYALFPVQYSGKSGEAGMGVSVGTNGITVAELADSYFPTTLVSDQAISGWSHIVVAYRNGVPSLYVNGRFVKQGVRSTKRVHPDFSLGGNAYGWYSGRLRDLRLYPRTLTAPEIGSLAEGGNARRLAWTLDPRAGTAGLSFTLAPIVRAGLADPSHAGMGLAIGTNGVSVCESSDDYLPSVLVDNRPITGWTHVAVVYRDNQPSLYLNGVFEKAGCRSDRTVHPAFRVGKGPVSGVKVFGHALTDAEVQVLASRR